MFAFVSAVSRNIKSIDLRRFVHTVNESTPPRLSEQTLAAAAFVDRLQALYCARNPQYADVVQRIEQANMINRRCRLPADEERAQRFYNAGATRLQQFSVPNDHMAIRTIANETIGLDAVENLLLPLGFTPMDYYAFPDKHLRARWFAPPDRRSMPRLFVSELLLDELSSPVQRLLRRYVSKKPFGRQPQKQEQQNQRAVSPLLYGIDLATWFDVPIASGVPTLCEYEQILAESDYGAWTLMNGNRVNHCTIAVSFLNQPYNRLETLMKIARDQWRLPLHNDGAIQYSSDEGAIKQSSTIAITNPVMFRGSSTVLKIPGSFVEFIERDREGFEAQNANAIFESTDVRD